MKTAVTFGRYNLLTYGHLSTIKNILKTYEKLEILILDNSLKKENLQVNGLDEFYELCESNYIEERNPLQLEDRITMMLLLLEEFNLKNRVEVKVSPRIEYNYTYFDENYPISKYDLVFPEVEKEASRFDSIRNLSFEKILNRKVYTVKPELTLHFGTALEEVAMGKDTHEFFPKSVLGYLIAINNENLLTKLNLKRGEEDCVNITKI